MGATEKHIPSTGRPAPAAHGGRDEPLPAHPLRHLTARPRLVLSSVVAGITLATLPLITDWGWPTRLLVAWNVGSGLHIVLMLLMMGAFEEASTLRRARRLDEGALTVLALSVLAAVAGLFAVVAELSDVSALASPAKLGHVALSAGTVVTAWTTIQVMFAQQYAHDWFLDRAAGRPEGLAIPGERNPDYWDFLYVAVAIGTSGQTADVGFTAKRTRRLALVHSALAFFFNTTVLALTINIAAGLL